MGPRDWGVIPYNTTAPEASASTNRSAAKIAADFDRRFMAVYVPLYQECLAKRKQRMEQNESLLQLAYAMAAKTGGRAPQRDEVSDGEGRFYHPAAGYVRLWHSDDGPRARVEHLTTSAEKMSLVLAILDDRATRQSIDEAFRKILAGVA